MLLRVRSAEICANKQKKKKKGWPDFFLFVSSQAKLNYRSPLDTGDRQGKQVHLVPWNIPLRCPESLFLLSPLHLHPSLFSSPLLSSLLLSLALLYPLSPLVIIPLYLSIGITHAWKRKDRLVISLLYFPLA